MTKPTQSSKTGETFWREVSAQNAHCLSCNTCRASCAVHSVTGRLQPLKLVRLANLGLIDELLLRPETWYCLQCNTCSIVCPMDIQPAALVRQLRQRSLDQGVVGPELLAQYEKLCSQLHRARFHMVARIRELENPAEFAEQWQKWAQRPIDARTQSIFRLRASIRNKNAVLLVLIFLQADIVSAAVRIHILHFRVRELGPGLGKRGISRPSGDYMDFIEKSAILVRRFKRILTAFRHYSIPTSLVKISNLPALLEAYVD